MERLEFELEEPELVTNREGRESQLYKETLHLYNMYPNRNQTPCKTILRAYMHFHKLDLLEVCNNLTKLGNYLNDLNRMKQYALDQHRRKVLRKDRFKGFNV